MLPDHVPAYGVGPMLGLAVNGMLGLLCLAVVFTYRQYRPLRSLFAFYLTLSVYFLGFTIYTYQSSDYSISEGYRLMLLALCFAPVTWVWFALALQNARPGFWAYLSLGVSLALAAAIMLVDHPAVFGKPFIFKTLPGVWQPSAYISKPLIYFFDLTVVLSTLFMFWFRWWPAPGKPAYVRALVAGLAIWFLGGAHDAAYSLQIPYVLPQPITWVGSVWLSLCLALAVAFHLRALEESLRQSEVKFSKAFAANPDGLAVTSQGEGRILEVNEAFQRLIGRARQEILGRTFDELGLWAGPNDRLGLAMALREKGSVQDLEIILLNKAGDKRTVLLSAEPLAFDGQESLLLATRDISERKAVEEELARHRLHLEELVSERTGELLKANSELQREVGERQRTENALRESQANLQTLFDSLQDFLFVLDQQGQILEVNPTVLRGLGYRRLDLVGQSMLKLHPPQRHQEARQVLSAIAAGESLTCLVPLMPREGGEIQVETKFTQGRWGDQDALFGISRDVSERLRAQEILRQLAAGVAHNFNNLLAAILGNAQAAESLLLPEEPDIPRARQLVDNVVYSALSGKGVVQRLAAYVGRRQAGVQDDAITEVAEVVRAALDIALSAFRNLSCDKVRIATDLAPDLGTRVPRDEMMEICLNLIRNALEAMPQGGELEVKSGLEGANAWVSFRDTGQGIGEETQALLFQPFFTTKGVSGQGLGLASSRGIVRAYGGDITVESQPGRGSCFTVSLGHGLALPPSSAETAYVQPPAGMKVLLVEDEVLVALGTRAILESAGLVVRVAGGVAEAARGLSEFQPHLVLCDLGLPDGSGWDVARLLAASADSGQPSPPIILLTGWTNERLPQSPAPDMAHAWGLLHKPVDRMVLLKTLAQAAPRQL